MRLELTSKIRGFFHGRLLGRFNWNRQRLAPVAQSPFKSERRPPASMAGLLFEAFAWQRRPPASAAGHRFEAFNWGHRPRASMVGLLFEAFAWERRLPACFDRNKFVLQLLAVLILFTLASQQYAFSVETDYLPLCQEILKRRVPQRLLQDGITSADGVVRNTRCSIRVDTDGSVSIFGSDRRGKPWTLVTSSPSGAVSAWSADLDNNGASDIVLFMPKVDCEGWAPNAKVLVLMFEKNGRPLPWCTKGFFSVDRHGLKEFVDLDEDGNPELITQTRTAHFWVTSIFETRNCRWLALKALGGQALPFHTKFTSKANHSIIHLQTKPNIGPYAAPASGAHTGTGELNKLTLVCVDWCRTEPKESILVAKQNNCSSINSSLGEATVVMLDDVSGRRISVGTNIITRRLLEEMSFRKLSVAMSIVDTESLTRTTTLVYARANEAF